MGLIQGKQVRQKSFHRDIGPGHTWMPDMNMERRRIAKNHHPCSVSSLRPNSPFLRKSRASSTGVQTGDAPKHRHPAPVPVPVPALPPCPTSPAATCDAEVCNTGKAAKRKFPRWAAENQSQWQEKGEKRYAA